MDEIGLFFEALELEILPPFGIESDFLMREEPDEGRDEIFATFQVAILEADKGVVFREVRDLRVELGDIAVVFVVG